MNRIILFTQALIFLFACGLYAQPTNGLIAYFPMNHIIEDVIDSRPVIMMGSPVTSIEDRAGNGCALHFDGNATGIIKNAVDFSPSATRSRSVSLWFKYDDVLSNSFGSMYRKISESGMEDFSISRYEYSDLLFTSIDYNQLTYGWMNGFIADTNWHHVVATIEGYAKSIYFDGHLRNRYYNLDLGYQVNGDLLIGEGFVGGIDDIYVYDRILSDQEIYDLYIHANTCAPLDTVNNKLVIGKIFEDLNGNGTLDLGEYAKNGFDFHLAPSGLDFRSGSGGKFSMYAKKYQLQTMVASNNISEQYEFSLPQSPIDLTNYQPYIYDLGWIGVHSKPAATKDVIGILFYDFNGNNIFDGNDYGLNDFTVEFQPSGVSVITYVMGIISQRLDSGTVQTLTIPISMQDEWVFSAVQNPLNLIGYLPDNYELGYIGIHKKEYPLSSFITTFPNTLAHSRNGEISIKLINQGNISLNGSLILDISGTQLIRKFVFPTNYTELMLNDSTIRYNFPISGLNPLEDITSGLTVFSQAAPGSRVLINYTYTDISGFTLAGSGFITIVAPHDPNYIAVDHEKIYKQFISDQNQLSYTVHFQNLGTAPAENVVIRQILPQGLKSDNINIISSSSPTNFEKVMNGNESELIWTFENINLPSFSEDSIGSSGYVSFSLFPETLEKNDSIVLDADIYFDSQPAIQTNEAITSLICKGEVGQNMVDFISFAALCFGDISGGVLMNANIDTASISIIFNNEVQVPYTTDTLHLLAGNYTVSTTDELGCSQSQFVVIKQPSKLNSSIIDLSEDKKELLVGGGTPPYSILWNNGYTGYELDNLPVGTNIYTITDANGCTLEGLYEKSILKINESSPYQDIKVYPNPVKSLISIEWKDSDFRAVILDLQGREIKSFGLRNNKAVFDFSELGTQVYLLKLTSTKGFNKIIRLIKL